MSALPTRGDGYVRSALAYGDLSAEHHRDAFAPWHGREHRLEHVATKDGVHYVDDSRATNVNSAWLALETVDAPIIWIAGGNDKGNDYTLLLEVVARKVKAVVCLGLDNTPLHGALGPLGKPMYDTRSAQAAVDHGLHLAEPGDTVLLSPACASFDLFEHYEDRGRRFKAAVATI